VSTAPECVPNCDDPDCSNVCATGAPCASGCCSANVIEQVHEDDTDVGGLAQQGTALRAGPGDLVYFAKTYHELQYTTLMTTGSSSLDLPDFSEWNDAQHGPKRVPRVPLLAMDNGGLHTMVYLAYYADTLPGQAGPPPYPAQERFGINGGSAWVFEDAPAGMTDLEVDSTGQVIALGAQSILVRYGANDWRPVAFPSALGGKPSDLAVDDQGNWYAAGGSTAVRVARRDSSGTWYTEEVDAVATVPQIVYAAGTVHVAYATSAGIKYARRVGTSWQKHIARATDFDEWSMSVDACGAPHFGFTSGNFSQTFMYEDNYLSWTAQGWRSVHVGTGCDITGMHVATTTAATYVPFYGCSSSAVYAIPLE
jgi:hypothetical protein